MYRTKGIPLLIFSILGLMFVSLNIFVVISPSNNISGVEKSQTELEKSELVAVEALAVSDDFSDGKNMESYGRLTVLGSSTVDYDELIIPKSKPVLIPDVPTESPPPKDPEPTALPVPTFTQRRDIAQLVFNRVNQERVVAGLTVLTYSQTAVRMAESHCEEMAVVGGLIGHTDLVSRQRYFGVMPPATTAAENEAYFSTSSANNVVSRWMASCIHRDNIINSSFTKAGVGVVEHDGLFFFTLELSN